jgi:DNA mismatch repair protein, C-terminal domain
VKVCSKGQFISIDGRPISTTRGVFKDFVKLYKVYYRNRISGARSTGGLIDPFLALQLRCPAGSYDVNIEPAKDEVLFADARNVLKLLEDFLESVYGSLPEKSERKSPLDNTGALSITQSQPFGLLLARKEQHLKETPGDGSERDHMPGVISRIDAKYPKESLPEKGIPAASESAELSFVEDVPSARQRPSTGNAKLHRNMFDFDEDDMSSMERPLSPEGNCNSGSDDAELRKASITNPWTIAKLNAPILSANGSPLNRSSGNSIEQLMTPGPDSGVSDGVSTSRTQTFGQVTNLPSPAGSDISLSPPPYQIHGSPIRRRAPLHVDDEIEFTQETADNSHTRGHPTSLDQWVKPRAHKVHLTSFHRASEIIDTDNRSKHQNDQIDDCDGNAPTGIQSTQLTEPVEDTCHKLQSRNQIKKPLIPPFKTPERALALHPPLELKPTFSRQSGTQSPACQPGVRGEHNLRNTSPSSHAHPPPLSHLHQHPMASPPRLQPSSPLLSRRSGLTNRTPNLELDEIMDFEHRKKAVNAQRKGQTKLTNRYLNPGQLSQIQRESAASLQVGNRVLTSSSPLRKLPAPSVNVRDETEKSYNPARPVDRHFPDPYRPLNQETADIASLRQSPHQNRYQAAKAALTGPKPPNLLSSAQSPAEHESAFENTNSIEIIPPLPKTDPRTYLMQHRSASPNPKSSHDPSTVPSFTRPGLKIKRAKTFKLPFETIPAEYATYNLSTKPATSLFPSTENFTVRINDLDGVDDYIRTGKNQFVVWDADSMAVSAWEEEIVRLVRQGNVAKKAGSAVASREELTPADLQLRLNEALRAHREEFA